MEFLMDGLATIGAGAVSSLVFYGIGRAIGMIGEYNRFKLRGERQDECLQDIYSKIKGMQYKIDDLEGQSWQKSESITKILFRLSKLEDKNDEHEA